MIETLILAEILAIIFYLSTQQEYMDNKTISDIALDSLNNMNHMNKISSLYSQLLVLQDVKIHIIEKTKDLQLQVDKLEGLKKQRKIDKMGFTVYSIVR